LWFGFVVPVVVDVLVLLLLFLLSSFLALDFNKRIQLICDLGWVWGEEDREDGERQLNEQDCPTLMLDAEPILGSVTYMKKTAM